MKFEHVLSVSVAISNVFRVIWEITNQSRAVILIFLGNTVPIKVRIVPIIYTLMIPQYEGVIWKIHSFFNRHVDAYGYIHGDLHGIFHKYEQKPLFWFIVNYSQTRGSILMILFATNWY